MRLDDFDYQLPEELIAQHPVERRDASRLMVVNRSTGTVSDHQFPEILNHITPDDLLIFNDTRVFPARLYGKKESGGQVELLLVKCVDAASELWECLGKASKPLRSGTVVHCDGGIRAEVVEQRDGGLLVRFEVDGDLLEVLDRVGHLPLPPYIKRADELPDRDRYQTRYAKEPGALAAPTAGLHFSDEILAEIDRRGLRRGFLTLHVGLGTFLPVRVEVIAEHRMHREWYSVSQDLVDAVAETRRRGGRVIAVGTTSARALESATGPDGLLMAGACETDIFIYPGYRFKTVDALVTNFHLPKSTLLMLISAFAGKELIDHAYRQAVAGRYRFFSYGDCMLIE